MWNEILGALTILGMIMLGVVLLPAAPKLVDAVCDRIRYGVQPPAEDVDEDEPDDEQEDEEKTPAAKTPTRPAAPYEAAKTPAKPAATRTAA